MKKIKIAMTIVLLLLPFTLLNMGKAHAQDYYSVIYSEVANFNQDPEQIDWTTNAIIYASQTYNIDPFLLTALLEQESGFNINAYSPKGAIGMAQLMPGTAAEIGIDPYNPLDNILGGAYYLAQQLNSFSGYGAYSTTYAVAAYNAGPGAVAKYGGVPPYEETINYVESISGIFNKLNAYR